MIMVLLAILTTLRMLRGPAPPEQTADTAGA